MEVASAAHTKLPQLRYRTSAIRAKAPWAALLLPGRVPVPEKIPMTFGHDFFEFEWLLSYVDAARQGVVLAIMLRT